MDLQNNKNGEPQGLQYVNYKKSSGGNAPTSYPKPFKPAPGYSSTATPSHRLITTIITILFLVLLLGGVGYMIFAFVQSPDRTIHKALSNFDREGRIHSNLTISLDSASPQLQGGSFSVITDTERPAGSPVRADSVIDLSTPGLSGTAEIRFSDDTFYFNVIHMPEQLAKLRPIANLWYSASSDTVSAFLGAHTRAVSGQAGNEPLNFQGLYDRLVAAGIVSTPQLIGLGSYDGVYVWRYKIDIEKPSLIAALTSTESRLPDLDRMVSVIESIDFQPMIVSVGLVSGDIQGITMDMNVTAPNSSGILATVNAANLNISYVYSGSADVKVPPSATALDSTIAAMLLPAPPPVVSTKKK